MDENTRDLIAWTLGTALTATALVGLAVRYVLLPWLREHLVVPVKQVEKQVTENKHANTVPTVLDRLDDVRSDVQAVSEQVAEATASAAAVAKLAAVERLRLDRHLGWSHEEANRLWREVTETKARLDALGRNGTDDD